MLDRRERNFVEQVKKARDIRIVVNYGSSDELTLVFDGKCGSIGKLRHDVAMAVQDKLNKGAH